MIIHRCEYNIFQIDFNANEEFQQQWQQQQHRRQQKKKTQPIHMSLRDSLGFSAFWERECTCSWG